MSGGAPPGTALTTAPGWRGHDGCRDSNAPANFLAEGSSSFAELSVVYGEKAIAEVDFDKEYGAGCVSGRKALRRLQYRIIHVEQTRDKLRVEFWDTAPSACTIVTTALTQPYHLVVVQKIERKVQFDALPLVEDQ